MDASDGERNYRRNTITLASSLIHPGGGSFSPLRVSSSSLLKHSISYITHSLLLSEAKRVDRETGGIGTCHFEKRRSINERGISIRGGA